ncbi:UPF0637 protein [Caldalkalibacillus thermarum TA2.A1]|uniref:UPF0637 protein CathTA2_2004 n=1 Tax=Caldalkalibacillus thermarum (strain TA2.A1) TaxID=986075 RepID=F5L852_CALTT|nr:DUF1054 domain-containing protein [Caldalkalibacillus thermarum]EGL82465.1 UPF0637 protein [Caldalkalibacillus thermarum TA2.A1]QZT33185.1 DUF1054 domain-containing protein [Caldalkalibacillus thermarum TA2.A1]
MRFEGFSQQDFETFHIDGLDERMAAIRERIQPKFRIIGETLATDLTALAGNDMFLHIAKHARRTKNPPDSTWLAICHDNRGYKKHPHFQVGLFDDHVFIWLAYIYELPNKKAVAQTFLDNVETIRAKVPDDYVVSLDHTKKDAETLKVLDLQHALERFRDVKKAEFLIGRHVAANDPVLRDGDAFLNLANDTFKTVFPIYKLSFV